jgi:hypothetical protein
VAGLATPALSFAEKIYVFYPSMSRPNVVQSALAAKCSGMEITVFGRLADFTAMMNTAPPDAIVAPKALADQFPAFKPFLKGTKGGSSQDGAVLLSSGKNVDPKNAGTLNIGVASILDRAPMNGYVTGIVGGAPKLKLVTKVEDLLPLLTFQSADAVLVGQDQAAEIKAKSQAPLVESPVPGGKIGLIVASAKSDGAAKNVEASLKSLGAAEKKMLGVDGWTK